MIFGFFLSFSRFPMSLLPVVSYMTLSSRKTPISENNSLMTPFFTMFLLSHPSNKHYFSKYCGRMHSLQSVPTSNFGRPSPSPPRSPQVSAHPLIHENLKVDSLKL